MILISKEDNVVKLVFYISLTKYFQTVCKTTVTPFIILLIGLETTPSVRRARIYFENSLSWICGWRQNIFLQLYMIIVERRNTKVRLQQMTFVHDHRDYRSYDMLFSFHDVELFLWICESTKIRATPTFSTYFYIPYPAKWCVNELEALD